MSATFTEPQQRLLRSLLASGGTEYLDDRMRYCAVKLQRKGLVSIARPGRGMTYTTNAAHHAGRPTVSLTDAGTKAAHALTASDTRVQTARTTPFDIDGARPADSVEARALRVPLKSSIAARKRTRST